MYNIRTLRPLPDNNVLYKKNMISGFFSWDLCYWVAAWHVSLTVSLLQWISITNWWTQQAQETEMVRPAYQSQLSLVLLIAAIFSCPIRQLCYNNPQCRYQAREWRRRGLSEDKETCPWYDQRQCNLWVGPSVQCGFMWRHLPSDI